MFRWKENQKLKSFYLVSDSFLPPLEKGDTKAFNEGQKGHCFIAKEVQDYELCIKLKYSPNGQFIISMVVQCKCCGSISVSYTHLTLPTNREV